MESKIEKKISELIEELSKIRLEKKKKEIQNFRKRSIQDFMQATGEKNEQTVRTILIEPDHWLLLNLRNFIISAGIEIYCVQMKCKDGDTAIHQKFSLTKEEANLIAEEVKSNDKENFFTEVQINLLFEV